MILRKKEKKLWIVVFFLVLLCVVYFFFFRTTTSSDYKTVSVGIGDSSYTVALADTPQKRTHGLSDTKQIPHDGMLFVFDKPYAYSFWMKDMHYPLDFIWLGKDKTVVDIHEHILPESYPSMITPTQPVLYVLEVPSGFIQSHGIKKGDLVSF